MQALNLIVFGAPGSGVSTLCQNLSKTYNFHYVTLRNKCQPPDSGDPLPLENQEFEKLKQQLQKTKGYLIDGSPCLLDLNLRDLDGIIYVTTPRIERLKRIREREVAAQGEKILKEGCREFKVFNRYMYWISQFDQAGIDRESKILHEKFLNSTTIPILRANGLLNQEDLIQQAIDWINGLGKD